jgi:hypothetical protein
VQISPKYADRDDLSTFLKWKFTFQSCVEEHPRVRSLYRSYALSRWRPWLDALWLGLSLIPLGLVGVLETIVTFFIPDEYDEIQERVALILYCALVALAIYLHPIGWLLVFMSVQSIAVMWLWHIMADYDFELERERVRDKYGIPQR